MADLRLVDLPRDTPMCPIDRALEVIRTNGGNPGAIDRWGKRSFAYEVNHKREGYYVVVEFTG